jgi:C1A family cysteine protease
MGMNQFTAMSNEEFKEMYLTLDVPKNIKKKVSYEDSAVGDVDWVDAGAVTPIKNQGQCGSCWAFSATGGMEGLSLFTTGDLHTFSEQQLVDCSGPYGNHGCQGGLMTQAYDYVIAKGVQYEDDYPYTARDQTCKKEGGKFKIKAYKNIEDCVELTNSLVNRPVSVAVDADGW